MPTIHSPVHLTRSLSVAGADITEKRKVVTECTFLSVEPTELARINKGGP